MQGAPRRPLAGAGLPRPAPGDRARPPTEVAMSRAADDAWPRLPLAEWRDTYATLHMWTQIVGKLRLAQTPWVNHSWHIPLYVTARGLTTSPIPYGTRIFQVDFDFIVHQLLIQTSEGTGRTIALEPRSVAAFYDAVLKALRELDLQIHIHTRPNEVD